MNVPVAVTTLAGAGVGVGIAAAVAYGRRPAQRTLSLGSTLAIYRGALLTVDTGDHEEMIIVRRILNDTTLAVEPYRGWRKLTNRAHRWCRRQWRLLKDRVYDWLEKDDDDD